MAANTLKTFSPGTVIVRENTAGSEMYIILQGSAGVYKNYQEENEILLATLGAGNFFGEMSLFLGKERSATIVALDDVSTLYIDSSSAAEAFSSKPDMIYSMINEFCKRIDNLNINYAKLKEQVDNGLVGGGEQKGSRASNKLRTGSLLFPDQHGYYNLPLAPPTSERLFMKTYTCPMCDRVFDELDVREEFRKPEEIRMNLRTKHFRIDPLYYQVKTCPDCYFSADFDTYSDVYKLHLDARKQEQSRKALASYRKEIKIKSGEERDSETIFAGYYLAVACAQFCFEDSQTITAPLHQKISWIYEDCGDKDMSLVAAEKALSDYKDILEKSKLTDRQEQRICYILGDLYERLGEFNKATDHFDRARKILGAAIKMNVRAKQRLEALEKYWGH